MAREILFKAKRIDNGEWVEGIVNSHEYPYKEIDSIQLIGTCYENGMGMTFAKVEMIDINTLCQYTGLTDKNGNKIWENDILSIAKVDDGFGRYYIKPIPYHANAIVKWDLCSWIWETIEKNVLYMKFPNAWCHYECEVIGNIFDNPELLGVASDE